METTTALKGAQDKATDFIKSLNSDIDLIYHIDVEELNLREPDGIYEQMREQLEDANAFDEEIIYYSRAMDFLKEHDPSLQTSLQMAHDMGYTADKINSELLASLLASDVNREDFINLESEITDFFTELWADLEATDSVEYAHFVWQKGINPEFTLTKLL